MLLSLVNVRFVLAVARREGSEKNSDVEPGQTWTSVEDKAADFQGASRPVVRRLFHVASILSPHTFTCTARYHCSSQKYTDFFNRICLPPWRLQILLFAQTGNSTETTPAIWLAHWHEGLQVLGVSARARIANAFRIHVKAASETSPQRTARTYGHSTVSH